MPQQRLQYLHKFFQAMAQVSLPIHQVTLVVEMSLHYLPFLVRWETLIIALTSLQAKGPVVLRLTMNEMIMDRPWICESPDLANPV
jgi:cellulose synthase/poly-beta-1,6-N-acetylglucosamine synthase-like glycosyltransferase